MPAVTEPCKVLVTGTNGFIAVWILKDLLDKGFYIKLADLRIFKEETGYEVHFKLRAFKVSQRHLHAPSIAHTMHTQGHLNSHSDRPQHMVVRSVQRPELAPFDLPSWLNVYLISIGAFQDFTVRPSVPVWLCPS